MSRRTRQRAVAVGFTIYTVLCPQSRIAETRVPRNFTNKVAALAHIGWLRHVGNIPVLKVTVLTAGMGKIKRQKAFTFGPEYHRPVHLNKRCGIAMLKCPPDSWRDVLTA